MDWSRIFSRRLDVRLSVIFVAASALAMILLVRNPGNQCLRDIVAGIWVIWTAAPPLYFLMEWTAYTGSTEDEAFKKMKYSHELASKFWLGGIGVVSAALVFAYGGIDKVFK